mgnify:CR=1 FL=1
MKFTWTKVKGLLRTPDGLRLLTGCLKLVAAIITALF